MKLITEAAAILPAINVSFGSRLFQYCDKKSILYKQKNIRETLLLLCQFPQ